MRVLHTIHLHGKLAAFGETHSLCVASPVDAVRALCALVPGFAESFREGAYRLVRGKDPDNGVEYGEEAIHFPIGRRGTDFHFVPVVAGAGGGGGGKIIIGAIIMIAAVVAAPFTGGTSLAAGLSAFSFGFGGATAFALGAAVMLAGVAQVLQPSVKANYGNGESADQRASFFLGGQVNQAVQGGPVVLAYGRCRVGSTVVSAGLSSERM